MRLAGIAAYAPPNVVSNDEIAKRLLQTMKLEETRRLIQGQPSLTDKERDKFRTSDRWIQQFIGFSSRRFADSLEGTADLAHKASRLLINNLRIDPREIDGIIFGRVTPSYNFSPPDANLLQDMLGIPAYTDNVPRAIFGLDTSLACSTWVASLTAAYALIRSGMLKNILLVGADKMSRAINWKDRAFATVLGDAGTATLCSAVPFKEDWFGLNYFFTHMDGRYWDAIIAPKGGSRNPITSQDDLDQYQDRLEMDGRRVKELIVPLVGGPAINAALEKVGWTFPEIDLAVLHEANRAQLNAKITSEEWASRGFRGEVLDAGGRFANTTSASIPLALALNGDKLKVGKKLVVVGKGGSVTVSIAFAVIRHPVQVFTETTSKPDPSGNLFPDSVPIT